MSQEPSASVTQLLVRWKAGDAAALETLMPLVHAELRQLAFGALRRERAGHTLQCTALVNEAYVRLIGRETPSWQSRAHFFGIVARLMRQVLVDYARERGAAKRGDSRCRVSLTQAEGVADPADVDVVALDDALTTLAQLDPQQSQIVELRFFAGLSIEETADALAISPATVKRDWHTARIWLFRELDRSRADEP